VDVQLKPLLKAVAPVAAALLLKALQLATAKQHLLQPLLLLKLPLQHQLLLQLQPHLLKLPLQPQLLLLSCNLETDQALFWAETTTEAAF
jgi:hypothetical protein